MPSAALRTKSATEFQPTPPLAANDLAPATAPSLLRFITCGSVDDGKSTLIGRLLYDSKAIFEDQLTALDRDSRKFGTTGEDLDFALLVDGLAAEREQGITIDVAYRYFSTPNRSFIVADTPGHEQYTRNMATGASTAELAVILVDARKGILPQTRRHSFIVSMLGVKHIIVAINKMDLVGYDKAVFDTIVAEYSALAADLGFASVQPIPICARDGDNVFAGSSAMAWYEGPTVMRHLETIDAGGAQSEASQAFRFPVQWVNRPNLDFRGYSGWVASGRIAPGDAIIVQPSGRESRIARIVTFDGDLPSAGAGQAVTLTLTDEVDVSRGDVILAAGDPAKAVSAVSARLLWMSETPMQDASRYRIKLASVETNADIAGLDHVLDITAFTRKSGTHLAMNEIGVGRLEFDRPVLAAPYAENRDLGAFILIDRITNETVALGTVLSLHEDSDASARQRLNTTGATPVRSFVKAISWTLVAAVVTFAVTYWLTASLHLASLLAAAEIGIKTLLYFGHERLWTIIRFGLSKPSRKDPQQE